MRIHPACSRTVSLLLAAWLGLAAGPASAATPTASPPSLDEILERHATARGGLAAWQAIQTLVEIGRIEHGAPVPGGRRAGPAQHLDPDVRRVVGYRLDLARPHRMRLELSFGGATAIQAFDGQEGYTVQPGPTTAVARPFSAAERRAAAGQLDIEGPLLGAREKGTKVEFQGTERVHDRPAYKLALTTPDGVVRHVWIDASTFLDVKIDGEREIGDRTWPIETYFGDFRRVGAVEVPYASETAINGVHTMERLQLAKVLLNAPLEDSRFTLPKAPAAP